jgi:hypothetical protein
MKLKTTDLYRVDEGDFVQIHNKATRNSQPFIVESKEIRLSLNPAKQGLTTTVVVVGLEDEKRQWLDGDAKVWRIPKRLLLDGGFNGRTYKEEIKCQES